MWSGWQPPFHFGPTECICLSPGLRMDQGGYSLAPGVGVLCWLAFPPSVPHSRMTRALQKAVDEGLHSFKKSVQSHVFFRSNTHWLPRALLSKTSPARISELNILRYFSFVGRRGGTWGRWGSTIAQQQDPLLVQARWEMCLCFILERAFQVDIPWFPGPLSPPSPPEFWH